MEKNNSKLKTAQWVLAVIGILMALSAFKKGGTGILGGILIFASAFVISPLFEKTPVLANNPKLRTLAQFAGAFLIMLLGVGISPSNRTETTTDTLETPAPTIAETIPETEIPTEIETIPDTPDDELKDRQIGDSVTIYGVTVTVNSVTESQTNSGSDAYEVGITYQNHSGKSLIITPYDWSSVLHTGSDKAHVGGDVSFHADTISNNEEWTGFVTLWKDETTEKVKFESSSLNLGQDNEKSATWIIVSDASTEEIIETEEVEEETEQVVKDDTEEVIPETEEITEKIEEDTYSTEIITSAIQLILSNSLGDGIHSNVTYDETENTYVVSLWMNGIAAGVLNAQQTGDRTSWQGVINAYSTLSNTLKGELESMNSDAHCSIHLLNDQSLDKILLKVKDGTVEYDVLS